MNIQNIEKKEKNMETFEEKVPADVFDNAVNEAYKKNKKFTERKCTIWQTQTERKPVNYRLPRRRKPPKRRKPLRR